MKNPFFEPTTKGNHLKLTKQQHVIPSKLIGAFADTKGLVEVCLLHQDKIISKKPDDKIFCVKRVWDQGAESGWMKKIEDRFQEAVTNLFINKVSIPSELATEFFLLWNIRSELAKNPPEPLKPNGISPNNLSKYEEEVLESKHYTYIDSDGILKSRFIASLQRVRLTQQKLQLGNVFWGAIRSLNRPFIAPKYCPQFPYIPLRPAVSLIANTYDAYCSPEYALRINKSILEGEEELVFAKSIKGALY